MHISFEGQSKINNTETLARLGTYDTGRWQSNIKTQHNTENYKCAQHEPTQNKVFTKGKQFVPLRKLLTNCLLSFKLSIHYKRNEMIVVHCIDMGTDVWIEAIPLPILKDPLVFLEKKLPMETT
jgi:hypothetical protein